ncbi:MAG: AgmX/PglI C-terminal domain-containing protein [Archangium sp.]
MSLEALAERTWKTQRVLVIPLIVLGAMPFIGGLVSGFPAFTGVGAALMAGGGFAIWRLRVKAAEFAALLANPQRVAQVVPIVQNVQGIVTHYPVVLVADDGKTYRIATWAKSVPEALAPFQQRFPHARGYDGESVFAPDDGFGARFKMIGWMFAAMFVGFLVASVLVLPKTLLFMSSANAAYEIQVKRNETEAKALAALGKTDIENRWNDCTVDSLKPAISVLLDGAQSKSWSSKRDGYLSSEFPLKLDTATDSFVYRPSFLDTFFNALSGSKLEKREMERGYGIVGVRRGDELVLRMVELDSGKTLCEGIAAIAPTAKDSNYEEDAALSAAVMRPFCAQLPDRACADLPPEPVAAVASPPPAPAGPAAKKKAPAAPAPSGSLDRDSILSTVRSATGRTRTCYESALLKNPKLQGTLTMAFTIGADGRVTAAQGSGFPDSKVTECVSKTFLAMRFPKPSDGKPMAVKYPLSFKAAN